MGGLGLRLGLWCGRTRVTVGVTARAREWLGLDLSQACTFVSEEKHLFIYVALLPTSA